MYITVTVDGDSDVSNSFPFLSSPDAMTGAKGSAQLYAWDLVDPTRTSIATNYIDQLPSGL